MGVGEDVHMQRAYATQSDGLNFKKNEFFTIFSEGKLECQVIPLMLISQSNCDTTKYDSISL